MNNTAENLDHLTYQMTDEEIIVLRETVFENNKKRYGIINREDVSDEVYEEMSNCLLTIPKTRKLINSFICKNRYIFKGRVRRRKQEIICRKKMGTVFII